jgi:RNA polymerase sigma factor (sigma-70 family)
MAAHARRAKAKASAAASAALRRRLWGLAYRLTGSAADADDVVQETFLRWLEGSPAGDQPPDGWLIRVATRIGIDALRARRRRAYVGPWLPTPVDGSDAEWVDVLAHPAPGPESRYGLLESVMRAFLVALEALGPRQRAVLLLRDVLGYSAAETAAIVGTTAGNVRVLHLRARSRLATYDEVCSVPSPELRARHRAVLEQLLAALAAQDTRALETLLADSVRTVTDGGGEYTALRRPLVGRDGVMRFYLQAARNRVAGGVSTDIRMLNGMPVAVIVVARPVRRQAPVTVMSLGLAPDGRVRDIHALLAPRKLAACGMR